MNIRFDTSYLKQFARPEDKNQEQDTSNDSESKDLIKHLDLDEPENKQNQHQFTPQKQVVKNRSNTLYSSGSSHCESLSTNYSIVHQHLEQSMIVLPVTKQKKEEIFYKTMPTSFQQFQFKNKRRFEPQGQTTQFQININNVKYSSNEPSIRSQRMNIPNKYTQPLLLERIDKNHKDTYDFIYLPIDFTNKCNVGYAFINFVHVKHIRNFFIEFHDKKWDMFNSDKICQITYGRIQGVEQLQSHFQYSTIMQEKDKKLKPVFKKQIQDQRMKNK